MAEQPNSNQSQSNSSEIVKWILGVFASLFMLSVKLSIDNYTQTQENTLKKIDKVYEFASDHELRLRVIEQRIKDNEERLYDLEIQDKKAGIYFPVTPYDRPKFVHKTNP